jgi:hypothetical protein
MKSYKISNKYVFITIFLIISNIYAEIVNLSENDSVSNQPKFLKHNNTMFVFWVDDQNNIFYRYKIIDQWSDTDTIFCLSEVHLHSVVSDEDSVFLLWVQCEAEENKLMIGVLDDSLDFESNEIISYNNYLITSSSLFIDDMQKLNITWDIYQFSDILGIYHSSADDIYSWETPETLFEIQSSEIFDSQVFSQLVTNAQNDLYCFWLSNDEQHAISYTKKDSSGNWTPVSQLFGIWYGFGANFTVKNDVNRYIHIVSNIPYLTTYHNDLIYLFWDGNEWSYPELVPYWTNNSPLNERWNPDIAFLEDNSVYIAWEHYAFSENLYPRGSWIGSSVKLAESWHENGPIASYREPHCPKVLIENDQIHNVWYDQTDGDFDIYYTITEPFTSTDNDIIEPTMCELYQNYPNPFNPETTIQFTTQNTEKNTELVIYNLKGQKVKTLINEVLPAGEHSVVWDGKNTNNKAVATGIYFYNLKVDDKIIAAKKCLLLK